MLEPAPSGHAWGRRARPSCRRSTRTCRRGSSRPHAAPTRWRDGFAIHWTPFRRTGTRRHTGPMATPYSVVRTTTIDAPAETVHALVRDFHQWGVVAMGGHRPRPAPHVLRPGRRRRRPLRLGGQPQGGQGHDDHHGRPGRAGRHRPPFRQALQRRQPHRARPHAHGRAVDGRGVAADRRAERADEAVLAREVDGLARRPRLRRGSRASSGSRRPADVGHPRAGAARAVTSARPARS